MRPRYLLWGITLCFLLRARLLQTVSQPDPIKSDPIDLIKLFEPPLSLDRARRFKHDRMNKSSPFFSLSLLVLVDRKYNDGERGACFLVCFD